MASRILALRVKTISSKLIGSVRASSNGFDHRTYAGNREVVCYGINGQPNYIDRADFPMPALRWKETTPDIQALREKEKGDWKQLSIADKKALYRASFRQTFSEFKAPNGEWKSILGIALFLASFSVWSYMALKLFVYNDLPVTFDKAHQEAQLKRMLAMQNNPIEGIASKWDYENKKWK